ncbi:MAG: hypothetical protein JXQ82_00750 [Methanomicrobiaceae archaeon]|nr:hypothetical protein [Methanomicrobiaceae archaeon]
MFGVLNKAGFISGCLYENLTDYLFIVTDSEGQQTSPVWKKFSVKTAGLIIPEKMEDFMNTKSAADKKEKSDTMRKSAENFGRSIITLEKFLGRRY